MDALHQARVHGLDRDDHAWSLQRNLMEFLEGAWDQPDEGIWEVRGPRRHFTHSKVLAWVAFDRAVQAVERFDLRGPVDRWRRVRAEIHEEVCREGFNVELELVHAGLRLGRARRVDAADPDSSASCRRTIRASPGRSRRSQRDSDARRIRRAVPARRSRTTSTACPAARVCSCRARSGSSTRC